MSHKRMPKRKAAIAVGGVAALGAAALLLPNANASQDKDQASAAGGVKTLKATQASGLAAQVQKMLGDGRGASGA
ncbi:S1 family peptidase, partial [Streptomyces sp. NPDC002586]